MLPLAGSFRYSLSSFVVSVFVAIIGLFFRIQVDYGTLESVLALDGDERETVASIEAQDDQELLGEEAEIVSVVASNSSKFQVEHTAQIHGFVEESETTNCFVEELYCDASPSSSGNQTPDDDFECYSGKYLCEFSSETEEGFDDVKLELFSTDEALEKEDEHEDLKSNEDGPIFYELPEVSTPLGDCSFPFSDSDSESPSFDEEFIEIELELEPRLHVSNNAQVCPVNDWSEEESKDCLGESLETERDEKGMEFEEEEEEEEEEEDDEFSQEHQDLIAQLKIELRNSRTGGLPTVQEEEEAGPEYMSPTSVEALKPLKNGGNFEHRTFKEIQKVYKTYAQKMRKLDVSNTQTNYAIDFIKLKDPFSSMDEKKSGLKSVVSHKLRAERAVKGYPNLMRDLKRDMEMVYVGHLCLSWEVLHWQHRKAIELQQNDTRGTSRYTRVVNEFQFFCILIQRFVEDELFCGPRINNYVKNRLLVRSLLQVPAIREDCVNDKKLRGKEGESTISTAALVSMIEESMWVFRDFLRADKDVRSTKIKCAEVEVNAQAMMMEIRTELRKKERRLKEIVRGGHCIVKKLKRVSEVEEGRLKNELLIAEVELKLVSRVVSMCRLTESQLVWCHKKLHQINFVNRKVIIEPSFSFFPS